MLIKVVMEPEKHTESAITGVSIVASSILFEKAKLDEKCVLDRS
jgi:hypothetical protein